MFTLVNMNAQEIITDRPDQTESSSTVMKGKLQWETGFSYERLKADYPNNDLRADFGFTYLVRPNLQLDLSSGLGFSKISPDFFISTGLSWRIPD